jgi:Domain of unknown function (DUF6249)
MRSDTTEVVVILVAIAAAVGTLLWSLTLRYRRRELQHKERMAALEKGAPLPALTDVERQAPWTPRVYLLRGLMWLFSGIGLALFLAAVSTTSQRPKSMEYKVALAQRLKDMGATEEQIRQAMNDRTPSEGPPVGFALIGMVPIGIGLAYLIFYAVEGRKMVTLVERAPAGP